MRRLLVVLALAAALGLGAGAPTTFAQTVYDPYGGLVGAPGMGFGFGVSGPPGVGPFAIPGPYPAGPFGSGGYGGPPGYGGAPYGSWPNYAAPLLSGVYNSTGFPTFGLFPYLALNGNVGNPSPYYYYNPYALFLGCTSTYTASSYYVCR